MTTQDYDDRDAEFTGVLAQRLKPGEDASLKLPKLYEALGVETAEAAVLVLARMVKGLEGFKLLAAPRRKRKSRGRPTFLSLAWEKETSYGTDQFLDSSWVEAWTEGALLAKMGTVLAAAQQCGEPIKVLAAAFRVLDEELVGGRAGFFHVDDATAREIRPKLASYLASLYTHRARRRERNFAIMEAAFPKR